MYSLLIVDDDPCLLSQLEGSLASREVLVATAGSYLEALQTLDKGRFEAALIDVHLSNSRAREGLLLIHRLNKTSPETKILVMSTRGGPADVAEALALGANHFLHKPFDLAELVFHLCRIGMPGHPETAEPDGKNDQTPLSASLDI